MFPGFGFWVHGVGLRELHIRSVPYVENTSGPFKRQCVPNHGLRNQCGSGRADSWLGV